MSELRDLSPLPEGAPGFELSRNGFGKLCLSWEGETPHEGVVPVRAFPIAAPEEGLSLVSAEGKELVYLGHWQRLPQPQRALIEEELAQREFVPRIRRIVSVSTFSTPSSWQVETDRGLATLVLKVEEDIRRLPGRGRLLISCSHGIAYEVVDLTQLDRASKRLLERFL
jgi:hypothetical protein